MITSPLLWAAALGTVCSASGFLYAHQYSLAGLEIVCGIGLAVGVALNRSRVTSASELLLILQTMVLGAVWPSAITIAALLVMPAAVLALRDLLQTANTHWHRLYVQGSTLVAAWSLAAEGWILVTRHVA